MCGIPGLLLVLGPWCVMVCVQCVRAMCVCVCARDVCVCVCAWSEGDANVLVCHLIDLLHLYAVLRMLTAADDRSLCICEAQAIIMAVSYNTLK